VHERSKDRRVTIGDVAAAAGVSVATVSKVINDRYGVAEETSARVRAVIDALGYHASLVGQSLRSRRTKVVGVLVRDLEPFSAELLKGVARGIHDTGYELVVFSGCGQTADQGGWERRYLSRISGTLADGAILVTPGSIDETFGTPVVAVDHNVRSSTLPTVDSENLEGAVTATEHLLALGHRRIGFIAGRADLASARLREEGYRQALAAAGITVDEALVRVGAYEAATATEAARELLQLAARPTAIFAANDVTALQTTAVARTLGLDVPSELSVVGFDNVPESALGDPPLTTVEQPIQQMGVEAVRLLLERIEEPAEAPAQVVLPTRLVVRGSTAPPPPERA
jgi:LacI family transcriptional regulator